MTVEQGAEADVRIRRPRHAWMQQLVLAGIFLAITAVSLMANDRGFALYWLGLTCLVIAQALWMRTFGVDLTPGSAILRGVRRRSVPWPEVQAVVRYQMVGAWGVRLILESGKPVTLRAPTTLWGLGVAEYEQDFDRIASGGSHGARPGVRCAVRRPSRRFSGETSPGARSPHPPV